MKRLTLISLLILCAAQFASAQDWARATLEKSSRHREWVTIKHDGRSVETFVVYPESKGKTSVVLIIHEIFGMTDWVQDFAATAAVRAPAGKKIVSNGNVARPRNLVSQNPKPVRP